MVIVCLMLCLSAILSSLCWASTYSQYWIYMYYYHLYLMVNRCHVYGALNVWDICISFNPSFSGYHRTTEKIWRWECIPFPCLMGYILQDCHSYVLINNIRNCVWVEALLVFFVALWSYYNTICTAWLLNITSQSGKSMGNTSYGLVVDSQ